MAQIVKNPPARHETWVRSLGWEDPLEECMATHSSILAWRMDRGAWRAAVFPFVILWDDRWALLREGGRGWNGQMASLTQWKWVWATPGDSEGQGRLACCSPWGHKERLLSNWITAMNNSVVNPTLNYCASIKIQEEIWVFLFVFWLCTEAFGNFSFSIRDWTCASCSGSAES